jgi:phage-related minor tail protein
MANEDQGLRNIGQAATDAEEKMRELGDRASEFAAIFSNSMRSAMQTGQEFDDMLRDIGSRVASMALRDAFAPFEQLLGSSLAAAFGANGPQSPATPVSPANGRTGGPISLNIQTTDSSSFAKSQSQIFAAFARAVRQGAKTS